MKITKIESIPMELDLGVPYVTKYGTHPNERVLVKMHTGEGITGFGESMVFPPFGETTSSVMAAINIFETLIAGEDPFNIERIHQKMDSRVIRNVMAKDAVDQACYDIMGKALNVPIHKLIGGCIHEKIPQGWVTAKATIEQTVNDALKYTKVGMKHCKIKVGFDPIEDVKKIKALREAVGPDVSIRVDANGAYPHIKSLKEMEKYGIDIVEQPAGITDLDGMRKYAEALDTPVLADEGVLSVSDAVKLIKHGAADIIAVKMYCVGGIYRAKQLHATLKALEVPCYIESTILSGIGIAANLQVATSTSMTPGSFYGVFGKYPYIPKDDLIIEPLRFENGFLHVPKKPGLGVEPDEESIKCARSPKIHLV